ncbi:MAG TPA: hypothetical protein VFY36_04265 [Solirubrobacteraceae bacterium]|nr:hypothetical protein [Solirubrobacteraceae bacterium]
MGGEYRLDLVEGFAVDQRIVTADHSLAPVLDDPNVVGITEQLVQAGLADRRWAAFGGWPATQTVSLQMFGQPGDRPVAGRVQIKGDLHQRRTLGIYLDRANVLVAFEFTMRPVANWRLERCPATQVLLVQALLDLGREVVGVVLREGREHAVHEASGGRRIDVLRRRYQGDVHPDKALIQSGVIQAVAG